MTAGRGWAQAVADGINGYIQGTLTKDKLDRQKEEDDFNRTQRARTIDQQSRSDALDASLRTAAAPVSVTEGAGNMTLPSSADNRDVGQPGEPGLATGGLTPGVRVGDQPYMNTATASAAADQQNSPDAIRARQVAALNAAGKPMEAQQLQTAAIQGQSAKFTLDKAMSDHQNEMFDKNLAKVKTVDDLGNVLSGSPMAGGKPVIVQKANDGKTAQLMVQAEDGTLAPMGSPVSTDPKELNKAVTDYAQSLTMAQKVTFNQHVHDREEQTRQFEENKKIAKEQFAENKRLQEKQIGISAAHLGIARDELQLKKDKIDSDLKNDPMHNLPGAVKIRATGLEKSIGSIETAINKALGDPGADPNSPGMKQLQVRKAELEGQRNDLLKPFLKDAGVGGNDDPYNMGYGKNPGLHPKTSAGQQSAAGAAGGIVFGSQPNAAPAAPAAANPAPSAVSMPGADPMAAQMAQESSELNRGTRLDFSPEVKQYIEQKKAADVVQQQSASDAYRQQDFQRSQAAMRGIVR